MAEPTIAAKEPVEKEMEAGTYYWCSCGNSKNQPFCDGTHQGSEFEPLQFTIDEPKTVYLCQCKRSGNKPFCDGAHQSL